MSRICAKASFNVVYFQHGVVDNSLTWIVHGPNDSIAYQAHELGFDVFLGNFRGVYPRKMVAGKDKSLYWDYNLNHLGHYDVQAFIYKIHQLKV
jgi:hypothetical protein